MSVGVELEELQAQVDRFGPSPYLLTVSSDGRPHATVVAVTWAGGTIVAGVGRRTAANVGERPDVSLLWPPVEADGFSLIVDGTASAEGDAVTFTPERAVLHRRQADGPGSDCVRLD
jgi:hypothetical protein